MCNRVHHIKLSTIILPRIASLLPFQRRRSFAAVTASQILDREPQSTPENRIYNHLLKLCLLQCKQIQSRRIFDEMPQRVEFASRKCKIIHGQSLKHGFASEGFLGNAIVDLYAKCGDMGSAESAFSRLERKDTLAWNSLASMYSKQGLLENVVDVFRCMQSSGSSPNQFTYAIVLSACARLMDVELGKQVHCSVLKRRYEFDSFTEGSLIDMYAKCCCLADARRVFDGVVRPDTVSWTVMISGYVQVGLPEEAMQLFEEMQRLGCVMDQVAFVTIINACTKLGRLDFAQGIFSQMPDPNVVAWNVMISGYAKAGKEVVAINFFHDMVRAGIKPTRSTLGSVLSAMACAANLAYGLQVHALAVKQGLASNVYVGSSLINMYAKCSQMEVAKEVFNGLVEKNDVLWNALLAGYAQNGNAREVLNLFMDMMFFGFQPDEYTYTSILSACACLEDLYLGQQLHSIIIKNKFASNLFVGNALVDMYAKSGSLGDAMQQFDLIQGRDHISWNAIIVGFVQDGEEETGFNLFQKMMLEGITPDEVSLASVLSACANKRALNKGKQVHCLLIKVGLETGCFAGSSLVDMYCKCSNIEAATEVFSCMPERSVISINALIAGYAQIDTEHAINLLKHMLAEGLKPSEVTFASVLDVCGDHHNLHLGQQIHCFILKLGISYNDEFLAISLVSMYVKSLMQTDARLLFSEFPDPKSTVLWTAMISSNIMVECTEEGLIWYQEMRKCNVMPDQATFASVLKACSTLASLLDGRMIHSLIFHTGFDRDELTSSSLVDMYAKCGDVQSSAQVFNEMISKKDIVSWNSLIVGFAKNGFAEDALKVFNEMKQTDVKPDEITFLGLLTACSHVGLVAEGREIFDQMTSHYGVRPRVDHCACMIDLLGRWGFLKEAEVFIDRLDFEPDAMIWATYLGACRIHGDGIRGQRAAEKLIELEAQNSSSYILLSNIYATSGDWDRVNSLRKEMKDKGVWKPPGCSWITVEQQTNVFVAGDKFHPRAGELHSLLKDLTALMKDKGYGGTQSFLHDEHIEYELCRL
ncbi:PREDICTED: pentatricopeptide repeat-containing protein At3g09040, mitochondrial [Ipomoea nil]|uniref:pentatricopeptide repeat-containing protein At3g09040, mitochondrial n=1 Tax=Ipomoea nil TaxID=35883 RepID=UPI000901E9CB|nr:PREDICTED: pentatricopeptide repeat-containing protein At3g09040, mitochondrial [Ipomoea nil]